MKYNMMLRIACAFYGIGCFLPTRIFLNWDGGGKIYFLWAKIIESNIDVTLPKKSSFKTV